jgi:hypothetical protein
MCGEYVGSAGSTDNGGKASWSAEGIAWDLEVTLGRSFTQASVCFRDSYFIKHTDYYK